jgi:hypothetical protein
MIGPKLGMPQPQRHLRNGTNQRLMAFSTFERQGSDGYVFGNQ